MNMSISFFVGCITFVLMLFIKMPIKKLNSGLALKATKTDATERILLYKRLNVVIIFVTMMLSMVCYYFVLKLLGAGHFNMCCSIKAGAIAVALYMVFEQWIGDDFQI